MLSGDHGESKTSTVRSTALATLTALFILAEDVDVVVGALDVLLLYDPQPNRRRRHQKKRRRKEV